jgi:hypothetical protein
MGTELTGVKELANIGATLTELSSIASEESQTYATKHRLWRSDRRPGTVVLLTRLHPALFSLSGGGPCDL